MILVIGFLTGFYCIGMRGNFVVAYSTAAAGRGKGAQAVGHLAYGAGKTLSYAPLWTATLKPMEGPSGPRRESAPGKLTVRFQLNPINLNNRKNYEYYHHFRQSWNR